MVRALAGGDQVWQSVGSPLRPGIVARLLDAIGPVRKLPVALHHFAQRAYYHKLEDSTKDLYAILEGPMITQNTRWDLVFYCGPKDIDFIERVDGRLEQALDYYGWFAPISRALAAEVAAVHHLEIEVRQ